MNPPKTNGNDDPAEDAGFKWDGLPLEVYEVFVPYLDGLSLMNLCLTSPDIARRVLEPYSSLTGGKKREPLWHRYCIQDLDRQLVHKIFSSFVDYRMLKNITEEGTLEETEYGRTPCMVWWEDVFKSYLSYSTALTSTNGDVTNQRLKNFENKLKAEMQFAKEATISLDEKYGKYAVNSDYEWIIRSGGGKIILNVMLPCPIKELNCINMLTTEVTEDVRVIHSASICTNGTDFLKLKLIYFPQVRTAQNSEKILDVETVVLGVCNKCLTTVPLLGGVSRRMPWPVETPEHGSFTSFDNITSCPLFEVHGNVMVVWLLPQSLLCILVVAAPDHKGYEFFILYRLKFEGMEDIWRKISKNPLRYLHVVEEYEGNSMLSAQARNMLMGDFYQPLKPVNYGISLVSPIDGLQRIRLSAHQMGKTVLEQMLPQVYTKDAMEYQFQLLRPTCSGKGHGIVVICSNTAIAVSWNYQRWLFGKLKFPAIHDDQMIAQNKVTHVEVINDNEKLLLVVNEDIILASITLRKQKSNLLEIEVKPFRYIKTGLASLTKEIEQIEVSFDQGRPFLLIIAKNGGEDESDQSDGKANKIVQRKFSFIVMRVDFGL